MCSECSKSFNVASNLKRHMKIHEPSRTVGNSADAAYKNNLVSFSLNTVGRLGLIREPARAPVNGASGLSSSVLSVSTLWDAAPMQKKKGDLQQEPALSTKAHPIQEQLAILEQQHLLKLQQQQQQQQQREGDDPVQQPQLPPQLEQDDQLSPLPEGLVLVVSEPVPVVSIAVVGSLSLTVQPIIQKLAHHTLLAPQNNINVEQPALSDVPEKEEGEEGEEGEEEDIPKGGSTQLPCPYPINKNAQPSRSVPKKLNPK